MLQQAPFLEPAEIEAAAESLLGRYGIAKRPIANAPVPIDKLVNFLGLNLEIGDLYSLLEIPRDSERDLLGALNVETKQIFAHETIDPEVYPWREGRYHFTVCHEIGHWELHRHLIEASDQQFALFERAAKPAFVCRMSDANQRIEWQANKFAGCLLMPRSMLCAVWHEEKRGNAPNGSVEFERNTRRVAQRFQSSIRAMRIRLSDLGLGGGENRQDLGL